MPDTFEIRCIFGNKALPVRVTVLGENLKLSFPYFKPMIEEVKAMQRPSPSWNAIEKSWTILNNRRNLFALDILTNGSKIQVYDKPIEEQEIVESFWSHQQKLYNFVLTRKRCILAAEMRTGKTLPTFHAISKSGITSAYWVAPSKALMGLSAELKKWHLPINVIPLTYEGFRGFVQQHFMGGHSIEVPQFVVFDECQKLKTPNSQVSEAAQYLSELMEETYNGSEYVVGLSGTPAPKDPTDWWSLCEVIRSGFVREGSKMMLGKRLGNWEQREGAVGSLYWHLISWKENEVYRLYKRLQPLVMVVLKKDCMDLPPIRYEIVELPVDIKMMRVAKTIADNEVNVLGAINKLRQLSDGFQYQYEYDEVANKERRVESVFVGSPKLEQLEIDLELHEDIGRLIVYAGFQGSVDIITQTCVKKGWIVLQVDGRGWQVFKPEGVEGEYTSEMLLAEMDRSRDTHTVDKLCFVGQADSAGVGLELSASPTIVYYSNTNKGESRMQSEARAHSNNMNKERGLTIIDYCYLPIDAKIREKLMMKKDLQSISMGELKQLFKEVV